MIVPLTRRLKTFLQQISELFACPPADYRWILILFRADGRSCLPDIYDSIGFQPNDMLLDTVSDPAAASFLPTIVVVMKIPMNGRNTANTNPISGAAASMTAAGAFTYILLASPASTVSSQTSTRPPDIRSQ
jgi:hypothetical protein